MRALRFKARRERREDTVAGRVRKRLRYQDELKESWRERCRDAESFAELCAGPDELARCCGRFGKLPTLELNRFLWLLEEELQERGLNKLARLTPSAHKLLAVLLSVVTYGRFVGLWVPARILKRYVHCRDEGTIGLAVTRLEQLGLVRSVPMYKDAGKPYWCPKMGKWYAGRYRVASVLGLGPVAAAVLSKVIAGPSETATEVAERLTVVPPHIARDYLPIENQSAGKSNIISNFRARIQAAVVQVVERLETWRKAKTQAPDTFSAFSVLSRPKSEGTSPPWMVHHTPEVVFGTQNSV